MDDDEIYFTFPWTSGGPFNSLAELELAYGDSCVDGAISDTAELWARRSQTSVPCVGSWLPPDLVLSDYMDRWADETCDDPHGDFLIGEFLDWFSEDCSNSQAFDDFVWDRFTEIAFESMTNLVRNIKFACGDKIQLGPDMLYKFRERLNVMPYTVRVDLPPMPEDMEEQLMDALVRAEERAAEARAPKRVTVRIPRSAFRKATAQKASGVSSPLAKQKDEAEQKAKSKVEKRGKGRHASAEEEPVMEEAAVAEEVRDAGSE